MKYIAPEMEMNELMVEDIIMSETGDQGGIGDDNEIVLPGDQI